MIGSDNVQKLIPNISGSLNSRGNLTNFCLSYENFALQISLDKVLGNKIGQMLVSCHFLTDEKALGQKLLLRFR